MSFVFFMAIANLRLLMPFRNFSIVANPAGLNPSGLKPSDTQFLWSQALRCSSPLTFNPTGLKRSNTQSLWTQVL